MSENLEVIEDQVAQQEQVIEEASAPEMPLGDNLSEQQIKEIKHFVVENFQNDSYDLNESDKQKKEVTDSIEQLPDEYNPELGYYFLKQLTKKVNVEGIDESESTLKMAAEDESTFQSIIQISLLGRLSDPFTVSPRLYRTFVGQEQFQTELMECSETSPYLVISKSTELAELVDKDFHHQLIETTYEHEIEKYKLKGNFNFDLLNPEIVEQIGLDRIKEDIRKEIINGDIFRDGFGLGFYHADRLIELGIISNDEMLQLAEESLGTEYQVSLHVLGDLIESSANPEDAGRKIKKAFLSLVADKDTELNTVQHIVSQNTQKYAEDFDKEYTQELIETVKETHGPIALLGSTEHLKDIYGEEYSKELIAECIDLIEDIEDRQLKSDYIRQLIQFHRHLSESQFKYLFLQMAEINPSELVNEPQFIMKARSHEWGDGEELDSDATKDFIKSEVKKLKDLIEPRDVAKNIALFSYLFKDNPEEFEEFVLTRLEKLDEVYFLIPNRLQELMSEDRLKEFISNLIDNIDEENEFNIVQIFDNTIELFGDEEAKNLARTLMDTRPELVQYLVAERHMLFDAEERNQFIDKLILSGNVGRLLASAESLAHSIRPEQLANLINIGLENGQHYQAILAIQRCDSIIGQNMAKEVLNNLLHKNPAAVLSFYQVIPEGYFDGYEEIYEYMKDDPRSEFARKYFNKLVKRLSNSEGNAAFEILTREAMSLYDKINFLQNVDGAQDAIGRVQEGMPNSSEKFELESINTVMLIAKQGIDPNAINDKETAGALLISILNLTMSKEPRISESETGALVIDIDDSVRLQTDPDAVQALERQIGSLIPVSTYALLTAQENREYLGGALMALESGQFKDWKYGQREDLIKAGILPDLTQGQYELWQENSSTNSSEIAADDAKSVATKFRQVIDRGLINNETVQKLAHIEDPDLVVEDMRQELAEFGKKIGEVHRAKKSGTITEEESTAELSELNNQKKQIERAINIIRLSSITPEEIEHGFLYNEQGSPTNVSVQQALAHLIEDFGGDGADAFEQLQVALDSYIESSTTDIGAITIEDTDDFQTTIEVGANPVGSCQHYEFGMYKDGLMGYFEPSVKIITVQTETGGLIARAALRMVRSRNGEPALVLEPTYMSRASDDVEAAVIEHASQKAQSMEIPLFRLSEREGDLGLVQLLDSRAPIIYSDVFGGINFAGSSSPRNNFQRLKQV